MNNILNVYPTRLKAEEEMRHSLASEKCGVALTGGIIGITDLEGRLLEELVPRQPIGEVERWLLLYEAVMGDGRGSVVLRPLLAAEGFLRSVGDLVQQIKLGLVKPEDMVDVNGFARGKEAWIKRIFRRYCASLKKLCLADEADVRMELIEKLDSMNRPPRTVARFDEIHFYDIYHFTPFRFELACLLGRSVRAVVHFPLPDDRRKVFDFVEREIQKFQSLEDSEGGIELSFDEEETRADRPLSGFTASIFDDEKTAQESDAMINHVEIIENSSRYREIEEAAQRIIEWKEGNRWSDFCLVFRDLEKYGAIIEDVFRRARIPVYMRRGVPARFNPYVRSILSLFEAIDTNYERDVISKIAGSQYFSLLPDTVEPFELEHVLIDAGITGGPASVWEKNLRTFRGKRKKGMATALKKVLKLIKTLEKLGRVSRAKACVSAFKDALKLLAPKKIAACDPFSIRDFWCMERFAEIMGQIESSLKSFKMAASPFQWNDLRRLLTGSLGNAQPSERSDRNNVYILNINELAGRTFPYVFVCGLHDGEFPRREKRGSILTEHEKKNFNKCHAEKVLAHTPHKHKGRAVFSRLGESWDEESFLFYLAARAATQKFVLMYSTHDLGGGELMRSPFLDDVLGTWPGLELKRTKPVAIEEDYKDQIDSAARKAKLMRDLFNLPSERAGEVRDYFNHYANTERAFILMCEKSRMELKRLDFYLEFDPEKRNAASTRFTGGISGNFPPLKAYFNNTVRRTFSPTALEKYSSCPFRFFMDRLLGCSPVQLPGPQIERTVEGTIIHSILESYYQTGKGKVKTPHLHPAGKRRQRIKECAKKVFDEFEKREKTGEHALWEITKEQISAALELFIKDEEKLFRENPFCVIATEMEFGKKEPLEIKIGRETINLRGFIDRVDYLPEGLLRVIDYKYTANIYKHSRLLNPDLFCTESFQMPIYAYAALSCVDIEPPSTGVHGAYGAYYAVKREPKISKRKPSVFDNAKGQKELDRIASSGEFGQSILDLVRRMEGGDFNVTPRDCTFCQYRPVCRYREIRKVDLAE